MQRYWTPERIGIQLMMSLTPRWNKVCLCPAYPWVHHRHVGRCKPVPRDMTATEVRQRVEDHAYRTAAKAQEKTLLGWTLEEFAVAAEEYRAQTGKNPLSSMEGAYEVQSYWITAHNNRHVKLPEPHPYHEVPVDLGWARALFSKLRNYVLTEGHLKSLTTPHA